LGISFKLFEDFSDFAEFFGSDFFGRERALDEPTGGAVEGAVEQVADEEFLGFGLGLAGRVDVGLAAFIAGQVAFFVHDLHELEGGGIAGGAGAVQFLCDLADRAGAAIPKDAEDGQLGVGGAGSR